MWQETEVTNCEYHIELVDVDNMELWNFYSQDLFHYTDCWNPRFYHTIYVLCNRKHFFCSCKNRAKRFPTLKSETPGKFWNVVLEKDGKGQLDWSCEKLCITLEQRNILHEISKWKANWIVNILRRNCLLQRVIEGKIQGE
jgi:hypothetical protein